MRKGMTEKRRVITWLTLGVLIWLGWYRPLTATTVLTIEETRQRALSFNRAYLSALKEIDKARSDVIKARAGALPHLMLSGTYSRNFILPSFFVQMNEETVEFKTGFKNNFGFALNLQQPLWHGGKVFTALKIAKLYKSYAEQRAASVKAEVLYNAEVLFYSVMLKKSQLSALEKAYEAASHNVSVVDKLYSQGLVSKFEVLRARVEKANLQPALVQARSEVRLSEKRLKSFLGIDLKEPIELVVREVDPAALALPPLEVLIDTALEMRPEIHEARLLNKISKKAVRVAKGGYFPSLDAFSSYSWQSVSDDFTLDGNTSKSWTAGITLTIPIFSGGYTHGEVVQRQSEYEQTRLALRQTEDDITLEVEQAYDQVLQAKEALEIQKETIEQAEEGLRIADLRYNAGEGTLLEVLSAQAALTAARNRKAEATFFFHQALSQLKKATTIDFNTK